MAETFQRTVSVANERRNLDAGFGRRVRNLNPNLFRRRYPNDSGRRVSDRPFIDLPSDRRVVADNGFGRRKLLVNGAGYVPLARRVFSVNGRRVGDKRWSELPPSSALAQYEVHVPGMGGKVTWYKDAENYTVGPIDIPACRFDKDTAMKTAYTIRNAYMTIPIIERVS